MNACIFVNREIDFQPALANHSSNCIPCDYIIAADGGARSCLNLGITPDLIIDTTGAIATDAESTFDGVETIFHHKHLSNPTGNVLK